MNYKIEGAIRRNRKTFIICAILWVFLTIVFVSPLSYSFFLASQGGSFDLTIFFETIVPSITNPFATLGNVFTQGASGSFFSVLLVFTIFYVFFFFIGFFKSAPKNEYSDIEHGSSDWSERGEQYRILSKNKGIILSKHNFLPTDKRGNVNVLVVGRFWFW